MPLSRRIRISLYVAGGVLLALTAAVLLLIVRFQPMARDYFTATLRERYQSQVDLGDLKICLFPTVRATGKDLIFRFQGRRDVPPMVQIRRFTLEAGFFGFFRNPKHIRRLRLEGLRIQVPPRSDKPAPAKSSSPKTPFILDEVIADGTTLETLPKDRGKNPLKFDIHQLTLRTVGIGQPMSFHAELSNPKPPGLIHSDGHFGPWNATQPTDTPVSGTYSFRNADLSVFRGITGTLSSDGKYRGELDRIEVAGTTDVPGFSLTIGGHPMPLHTDFQATVDGTDGDTILHPVRARLGRSSFEVRGAIDRGALETHKTILLEASTGGSRLEDFLRLSDRSPKPPMTGAIRFHTTVKIPPGETEVVGRLELNGTFFLNGVKFTSSTVQQKIASLSHHAEGDPKDSDPNVAADFTGRFQMRNGQLSLPDLRFTVPGAIATLKGSYLLRSETLDFQGTAKLDATVSEMSTGIKRKLLKPLDPFFKRDGAGTVLPIVISGTRGDPSFKLNIGRLLKRE